MATPQQLAAAFRKLRDQKKQVEERHKEELAPIKEKMAKLEAGMLKYLMDNNLESTKTEGGAGTIYRTTVNTVKVTDWETVYQYLLENELEHMLTRSVSKTAVVEYMESQEMDEFPGLSISKHYEARVRK